jgi:hypothetical protein
VPVECRQKNLVHPNTKVIIPETAGLLVFAIQLWKQEVKRDILKTDQPPKGIMWDLMHWPPDMVRAAVTINIMKRKGVKM